MDDDLRSLRNSRSEDDDLFGSFADPDDLGFDAVAPPSPPAQAPEEAPREFEEFRFEDPFQFPDLDESAEAAAPAPTVSAPTVRATAAPRAKPRKSRRRSGMTPLQRMILAVFLFLDVAVLGLFLLLAIGAISF